MFRVNLGPLLEFSFAQVCVLGGTGASVFEMFGIQMLFHLSAFLTCFVTFIPYR